MNLANVRVVIRPRYRLESADLAFRFVLGEARPVFGRLALATLLPSFGVAVAARVFLEYPWWKVWAVALVLGSLCTGVFTIASSRLLFEKAVAPRDVMRAFGARFVPYAVAMLLSRALIAAGMLLVVPGIVAWARFAFVPEAVLLEEQSTPLKRSARISRAGDDVVGTILASAVLSFTIVLGVDTMFFGVARGLLSLPVEPSTLFSDGGSLPALAGYFLSVPWASAYRFLAYVDGRTRQDAWDVQVKLMALSEGTAP